jgi:hypothetical protein
MDIRNYKYVLANPSGRGLFNLYPTMTAARDDMERANREFYYLSSAPYEPMTYDEYTRRERSYWLDAPAIQITAEKWNDMLEVLPPMSWTQEFNYNSFLMSEMMTGSYTHQYVRYGHGDDCTYWEKMVDATDRTTWTRPGQCPTVRDSGVTNA